VPSLDDESAGADLVQVALDLIEAAAKIIVGFLGSLLIVNTDLFG
jgi:hypothetical protein